MAYLIEIRECFETYRTRKSGEKSVPSQGDCEGMSTEPVCTQHYYTILIVLDKSVDDIERERCNRIHLLSTMLHED